MKNSNSTNENQKIDPKQFNRRNFYTIKDSGVVYLLALLLPLAASFVFSFISVTVAGQIGLKFAEDSNVLAELFSRYLWFAVIYLLISQVTFLLIWLLYHRGKEISFSATKFSVKKANVGTAFLAMLTGVICVLGFVWLMEGCFGKLFSIWGIGAGISFEIDTIGRLFVALLVLGVVPAICEELIFRGIIFGGLRKSYGMWTSVLLCGLLFALMHQSIVQLLYPFILGCVLSVVMEKTGNILYPILIHMFNNFATILMTFTFNVLGIRDINTVFNVKWWGILCAIALAGLTCLILWVLYHFYLCKNMDREEESALESMQDPFEKRKSVEIASTQPQQKEQKSLAKQESAASENSSFKLGKMPLTLLCGIVLGVILLVISLIP